MVAARIAATMADPSNPDGICWRMKVGKTASGVAKGASAVERVQADADYQEQRELEQHRESAPDQGALCVPQRAGRQEPLNDELIGPMRCHREECAADEPSNECVGLAQREGGIDDAELPGGGGVREDAVPSAWDDCAE